MTIRAMPWRQHGGINFLNDSTMVHTTGELHPRKRTVNIKVDFVGGAQTSSILPIPKTFCPDVTQRVYVLHGCNSKMTLITYYP